MKLACYKFNGLTLSEETFNMNKFNVTKAMRSLVNTMETVFMGITIPAIVFKASDDTLKYVMGGEMYNHNDIVPKLLIASSSMIIGLVRCMVTFLVIASIIKFIQSDNKKEFAREIVYLMVGYTLIELFKFIPIVIPNVMRAMGMI